MDILQNFNLDGLQLNFILVVLIIAGGYFQKRYWKSTKLNNSLKTLIIATIFTTIYLGLTCDFASWDNMKPCLTIGFVSYAIATSFYELILKRFKKTNNEGNI